jgi:glycine/serine hydroxymethyltransferase
MCDFMTNHQLRSKVAHRVSPFHYGGTTSHNDFIAGLTDAEKKAKKKAKKAAQKVQEDAKKGSLAFEHNVTGVC